MLSLDESELDGSRPSGMYRGWRLAARWAAAAGLALYPIVLVVACFFPPGRGGYRFPTIHPGDTDFYIYQLTRAGEVGGRWWKVADDGRLGGHYPPEVAKMPGIYEGVDLMLLCRPAQPLSRWPATLPSRRPDHLGDQWMGRRLDGAPPDRFVYPRRHGDHPADAELPPDRPGHLRTPPPGQAWLCHPGGLGLRQLPPEAVPDSCGPPRSRDGRRPPGFLLPGLSARDRNVHMVVRVFSRTTRRPATPGRDLPRGTHTGPGRWRIDLPRLDDRADELLRR